MIVFVFLVRAGGVEVEIQLLGRKYALLLLWEVGYVNGWQQIPLF